MEALKKSKILIIDDEEDILLTLKMLLKKHVGSVFTSSNPYHIPRLIRQNEPDLILLDLNFKSGATTGEEGLQWLKKLNDLSPGTPIIIITAHGDVEIAVEALKQGATDFIEKPWHNEKLISTIKSTLDLIHSRKAIQQLQDTTASLNQQIKQLGGEIIGKSAAIEATLRTIRKVAKTDANVLILGENGTGKEMVARAIHNASNRKDDVFIKVDVGAIPESLIESEFFGHKKGAFTDAHEDRIGRFEAAQNGTLFLDEIGNLSLAAQSKFLSAIQNMIITPVGTNKAVPVNFRLICATNESLHEMVQHKSFRQDLLYRINTIEIKVPPLREREGDIAILAKHFIEQYKDKYKRPELSISEEGLTLLASYAWPGNVRELQHTIERAVILSENNSLEKEDFMINASNSSSDDLDTLNLEKNERSLIIKALQIHKGNITKAAEELGLTRAALYRRLDKFGLQ